MNLRKYVLQHSELVEIFQAGISEQESKFFELGEKFIQNQKPNRGPNDPSNWLKAQSKSDKTIQIILVCSVNLPFKQ